MSRKPPRRLFRNHDRPRTPAGPAPGNSSADAASTMAEAVKVLEAGDFPAAIAHLEHVLRIDPASIDAKFRLAAILAGYAGTTEAEFRTAFRLAREILEVAPEFGGAHYLAAVACHFLGLDEEQAAHLEAASRLIPESDANHVPSRFHATTLRLESGDLGALTDFFRWEARHPGRPPGLDGIGPPWDGSPLAGRTILLHTKQNGHGDAFMFIRFAPMVKALGGIVRLATDRAKAGILAGAEGIDRVHVEDTEVSMDLWRHDVSCAVMQLPAVLGMTLDTIPARVPYLRAPDEALARWRPRVEGLPGLRVGIAWAGNPRNARDHLRSFRLDDLAPLADVPGVTLVNLQQGREEEPHADANFPFTRLDGAGEDDTWATTAAIVESLDLIVAPDSAVAHLAGALGRPVWIALPFRSEWRWLRHREDSPWYPAARLWRQEKLGDWGDLFPRMASALAELVAGANPRRL
ncbi:MAG: hypothetical protein ACLQGP_21175 [Isosphaeraceae bacterium]